MRSAYRVWFTLSCLTMIATLAACSSASPTAPSSGNGPAGATIAGTLDARAPLGASASLGAARSLTGPLSLLTVTVVGTNISATLDESGNFLLVNVPSGNVQLLFSGQGVNATTTLSNVGQQDYIQLQVALNGDSAASIVGEERSAATLAMCHANGNGRFILTYISPGAESAHLQHGDGNPGGQVPGTTLNTFGTNCETARVALEKRVNGSNADNPPGPSVPVGSTVTFDFVVRNVGEVALTAVAVSDDQLGAITCPSTTLGVDASMTCTTTAAAAVGQHINEGTVTASSTLGPATDSDEGHYFGGVIEEEEEEEEEEATVKVDLCHLTGNGRFIFISVDIDAQPAHMAHGDGVPGGSIPDGGGATFGPACEVPTSSPTSSLD